MQEIFVNIFRKFDFERQKMAEEKQGGKIITPLGWDIKRNSKGQFVPNNEQLRKLVYDKNVKLSEIDTSEITDMSYLFAFIAEDEEDDELFCKAVGFIAEFYFKREDFSGIGSWDTSKVTTFERMFYMADNFNEDISKWDTSSATSMYGMFAGAKSFNQNLSAWDISNVTDMEYVYWVIKRNAKGQFVPNNEQLRKLVYDENVKLSDIDTSEITDMKGLFAYIEHDDAKNFWEGVVDWAKDNNVKLDFKREDFSGIGSWDTSKVTTFERMFYMADNFNEDISKWDTSKAISFKEMFYETSNFNQPLNSWNTSKVTDMSGMFWGATNFNQPLDKWNTSSVTDMSNLFCNAFEFNCFLNDWDTSKVADMNSMFAATSFNQLLDKWDTSSVKDMSWMFYGTNFNQPLNKWNTSKVTNMSRMFHQAINFNQPLNQWNTSSVTNMEAMFWGAESFNQNLSAWGDKLGKVQNMKKMFKSTALNIDFISSWKIPEDCDISEMTEAGGLENKGAEKVEFLNFVIHKINIDESMLQGFSKNDSFIKSWLPESLLGIYEVFLVRYDNKSDEWSKGDEKAWDFAFCKVLGSWFAISKVINSNNDKVDKALPPYISKTLPFRIYQGQSVEMLKKSGEFDETNMYDTKQGLAFNFEQSKMRILNTAFYDMSDRVRDIVFAVVLAKAYNIKMENLSEKAKSGSTKEIQQCHTEVCEFDLKEYRSIPITQSGESGNGVLTEVWLQIFNVCLVGHKHDELKEAITQMARILTDNKRDSQSWWFSVAAVAIAFVSFVVAAISAVPVIEKWLG